MSRLARIVAPGLPHHVTQRGNRRQPTFFCDDDYEFYRMLLVEQARARGVAVWAWCLMPDHVHLVLVPDRITALADTLRETHRRYTRHVNAREGWRGFLWQGRFASTVLDERHLLAAARHVECNPVRAGLCEKPDDWLWSSARSHLDDRPDGLCDRRPLRDRVPDWRAFLAEEPPPAMLEAIRAGERTGRPLGDPLFIDRLEATLGRTIHKRKPGPKPARKRKRPRRTG
ncbi:MAG: transposase [Geminicoccaceae bacterium]|nr:transposase [Geminicoccaceae bacterium]